MRERCSSQIWNHSWVFSSQSFSCWTVCPFPFRFGTNSLKVSWPCSYLLLPTYDESLKAQHSKEWTLSFSGGVWGGGAGRGWLAFPVHWGVKDSLRRYTAGELQDCRYRVHWQQSRRPSKGTSPPGFLWTFAFTKLNPSKAEQTQDSYSVEQLAGIISLPWLTELENYGMGGAEKGDHSDGS